MANWSALNGCCTKARDKAISRPMKKRENGKRSFRFQLLDSGFWIPLRNAPLLPRTLPSYHGFPARPGIASESGLLGRLLGRRILLCHRLAPLWRILRRLIRLLVRSRLIRLLHRSLYFVPGRVQFLIEVFSRLAKFVHTLPQTPC